MNRTLKRLIVSLASFLTLTAAALAQLPTPTYGWNLGNTLEPPSGEGTWGPPATQQLISKGIPVLLGEYHATKRTGYADLPAGTEYNRHLASRTYFHKTVSDVANSMGIKPFYWDTAGGFFDWTTGSTLDPDNVRATTGGAAVPPPGGGF